MGRKKLYQGKPGHNHNYGAALSPMWGFVGYRPSSRAGQPGRRRGSATVVLPCYESAERTAGNIMEV